MTAAHVIYELCQGYVKYLHCHKNLSLGTIQCEEGIDTNEMIMHQYHIAIEYGTGEGPV